MKPTDYKGKTVRHIPTDYTFKVTGGKVEQGQVFLKDSIGELYSLHDCQLCEINQLDFDVRKLKQVKTHKELDKFFESRGQNRFLEAWVELEKDPVEVAAVAILYCDDWESFCQVTDGYAVSKERSPELNRTFRDRLSEKGLSGLVKTWYEESQK